MTAAHYITSAGIEIYKEKKKLTKGGVRDYFKRRRLAECIREHAFAQIDAMDDFGLEQYGYLLGIEEWLHREINALTGLPEYELAQAVRRRVERKTLDSAPYSETDSCCLNHVAEKLARLDANEESNRLWHSIWKRSSFIRVLWKETASDRVPVESPRAELTTQKASEVAILPKPKEYLVNWREIIDCLKKKFNAETKRQLADMNRKFDGPIKLPGQGGQPRVDKAKLLDWWNNLEIKWLTQGSGENATATVSEQYQHGKKGESVIPDIAGHELKKRKKQGKQAT
jgi:hypothetical protein